MRDSARISIDPNLAKSTCGQSGRSRLKPPRATGPAGAPRMKPFTNSWTSVWVMRPFGPDPFTLARSTPSSRANLRTEGLACGVEPAPAAASQSTGPGLLSGGTRAEGPAGAGRGGSCREGAPPVTAREGDGFGLDLAPIGECLERSDRHEMPIHMEEVPQLGA